MVFTCEYCKKNVLWSMVIDDGEFYHLECLKKKNNLELESELEEIEIEE